MVEKPIVPYFASVSAAGVGEAMPDNITKMVKVTVVK